FAFWLLLYAPGRFLLAANPPSGRGSRLLREVLLSMCCASWIGFVLAELGWFSLPALLTPLALVCLIARWRIGPARQGYGRDDLIGVAVVASTWLWVAPPLDTRILGADSSGYLAAGVHLSRHETLIIHDPTLARLSPDLKRALFPSAAA